MADDRIEIEIVLDDGSIQKGFTKVRTEGKKTSDDLGKSFSDFAKSAVTSLAGIAAGFASFRGIQTVVKNLTELETAFAEIKTIIPDVAQANDELRQSLIETSSQFGTSATEQAKAFYQIVSAGITDTTQASKLLETANKLAIGGLTDVGTSIDVLTSVVNAYGSDVLNASQASDTLFTTVRLGKTRVEELAASVGQIAPTAASLGISFQDVSAGLAALTTRGIGTSEAVTQLNAVFTAVLKNQEAARKLGPEVAKAFSLQALQTKGLTQFLGDLNGVLGGSEERLVKLLGRAEGARAILTLAGDGFKTLSNNVEAFRTQAGATETAFEQINETLGQQIKILTSNISNLFTSASQSSSKGLTDIVKSINAFVVILTENIDRVIASIGLLVKALVFLFIQLKITPRLFGLASRAAEGFVRNIRVIPDFLKLSRIALKNFLTTLKSLNFKSLTAGLKGFRIQLKLTSIALKTARIAANLFKASISLGLLLALDFLIEKFIELKDSFGGFKNLFTFGVLAIRESFNKLIISVIDFVEKAERLPLIGSKIKEKFGGDFDAIRASAKDALTGISEDFVKLNQDILDKTTETFDVPKTVAQNAVQTVKTTFQEAAPVVDEELEKLRTSVAEKQRSISAVAKTTLFDLVTVNQELFQNTKNLSIQQLQQLKSQLDQFKATTLKTSVEISNAVKNGLGRGIAAGIQGAVTALQKGENALSAFAKGFIGIIGDLSIQLGTQLIVAGIGLQQLFALNPGGAIAFGAALVAIGTLLKSFSGEGGGGASIPPGDQSVASPVIGDGGGSLADDQAEPQQGVNVVIQGDVFDSEDTGLRIADILKDQGFNNAVVS